MIILNKEQKARLYEDAGEALVMDQISEQEFLANELAVCLPYECGESLTSAVDDVPYIIVSLKGNQKLEIGPITLGTLTYIITGE